MIVKTKCVFLKKGIDPKDLEASGFETLNDGYSYFRNNPEGYYQTMWYADTRRFVLKYPRTTSARIVRKYVRDLFARGIVEIKPMYEWITMIGRWQDYPPEKLAKIERKLNELNKEE